MRGLGGRLLGKEFEGCPVSGVGGLDASSYERAVPGGEAGRFDHVLDRDLLKAGKDLCSEDLRSWLLVFAVPFRHGRLVCSVGFTPLGCRWSAVDRSQTWPRRSWRLLGNRGQTAGQGRVRCFTPQTSRSPPRRRGSGYQRPDRIARGFPTTAYSCLFARPQLAASVMTRLPAPISRRDAAHAHFISR